MKFGGICILTDDAPRLAAFYTIFLQEEPFVEGSHYGFKNSRIAVYDPGGVSVAKEKNMSIMFGVPDADAEYGRLLKEIPDIKITSTPEKRPWGAYSFWCLDPDGNTLSVVRDDGPKEQPR